jgi:hypothetical protein
MLRRTAAGICALMLAVIATLPTAGTARGASSCTGWTNTVLPPQTIRVYRTEGPKVGTVEKVDFRRYVEVVMAAEWPSYWSLHTLRAGALAVKQYGWYFAIHYRGKTSRSGACYDVVDYWADQVYDPEDRTPTTNHRLAVAQTWDLSLRQGSTFFVTGYRAYNPDWGEAAPCGADDDAYERIYQWSSADCGERGRTMDTIWRTYYAPYTRIVEPGAHHVVGDTTRYGDAAVITPGSEAATFRTRLYSSGGSGYGTAVVGEFGIASAQILGAVSADVTGDQRDDLVLLVATSATVQSLYVLRALAAGYEAPRRWWFTDPGELPVAGIDLLGGDFDGDRRADAALLATDRNDDRRSLLYLTRSLGSAFGTKRLIWSGTLNNGRARGYAGDANGDGRADLIVELDRASLGFTYSVAPSAPGGGSLGARVRWFDAPVLRRATTQSVVGDVNRDGRTDVVIAYPKGNGGIFVTLLRSNGSAFIERDLWISDTQPLSTLRIAGADATGDGRFDVIGYLDLGPGGTRIDVFRSRETSLVREAWRTDDALGWDVARPY